MPMKSGTSQYGFTYLVVLLAVAVLGIGLSAVSEIWTATARREKLAQLDWVGRQYVKAIGSYYYSTPSIAKYYPANLQSLLDDRRFVTTRRHLRTLYPNPFTGKVDWQLIAAADGRIVGIKVVLPKDEGDISREYVHRSEAMQ